MVRLDACTPDAIVTATIALEYVTENVNLGVYRNVSSPLRRIKIPKRC